MKNLKQKLIERIQKDYDFYIELQNEETQDDGGYGTRSTDSCINVKLRTGPDFDLIIKYLKPLDINILKTLNLDVEEMLNDIIGGDFGFIELAKSDLLYDLKESYKVVSVSYKGRSGGGLVPVFDFEDIPDNFDDDAYTVKELQSFVKILDNSLQAWSDTIEFVKEQKKYLEIDIKDPSTYIEEVHNKLGVAYAEAKKKAKKILNINLKIGKI